MTGTTEREREQRADGGRGPLLERDYWAIVDGCPETPQGVARMVARHFEHFPPPQIVEFRRREGAGEDLREGDELDVHIVGAGTHGVRVVHRDANSLTLATLEGHPEAGRITFGAYRNRDGDVIFHIRSRARAGSRDRYLEFLFAGDPMQTTTWCDFINRLAASMDADIKGAITARKRQVDEEPGDRAADRPTFIAEGD